MSVRAKDFDVAVVGGSLAGCSAARLFAQAGASVALIERRPDPAAYKVTCTHAIAATATPTIERLGLSTLLLERGAVRTGAEFWTPYGGWFGLPDDFPRGWGVTRRTIDPMLRELAVGTPGVEYFPGWTATEVLLDRGRACGVEVENRGHERLEVRARLVVGADGRDSTVARLARVPGRVRPNNRFFYFAYWLGVKPVSRSFRLWVLDPDDVAQFPNEDGLTLLVAAYHRSRLAEVRADPEHSYLRTLASLPDGPDLSEAERISKLIGKLELPNVIRLAARPGLALVGDAMLGTDPLWAIGLTNAFQSAEWLVDETSSALGGGAELDQALRRYRRKFLWRVGPTQLYIADYSSGRKVTRLERRTFRAATADPVVARAFVEVLTRARSPLRAAEPRIAARLLLPRRQLGYTILRRLGTLDPVKDNEEFMRLSSGVLLGDPTLVHGGLLVGFARQMAVPSIARVVYRGGRGDMLVDSAQRHDDTLTILGEIVRSGHSSPEGQAAIARMEHIHSRFSITDDEKRYTLATFVFEGPRAAERLGLRMSRAEREARWHFWRGVAEQMPLSGLPATPEEFLRWTLDYEREHWRYTDGGRAVVETMFDDWTTRWFPRRARRLGRHVLLVLMGEELRDVLRLETPSRRVECLVPAALRAYVLATLLRPLRTDRSWVEYFGRGHGAALDLERIGHLGMESAHEATESSLHEALAED
jgi:flavin-dependent dehydrogenase